MKTSTSVNGAFGSGSGIRLTRIPVSQGWGRFQAHGMIVAVKYVASLKGRLGWQNLRADEYTSEGPVLGHKRAFH